MMIKMIIGMMIMLIMADMMMMMNMVHPTRRVKADAI